MKGNCSKCGEWKWSNWRYDRSSDEMVRFCYSCGYEERKLPLDTEAVTR